MPDNKDGTETVPTKSSDTKQSIGPVVPLVDKGPVEPVQEEPVEEGLPTVKVFMNHTMHPEGTMIEVPGLGTIPNGGSKDVDYTQILMYEQATLQEWPKDESDEYGNLTIEAGEVK